MADNASSSKTLQFAVKRLSPASTPQLARLAKNRLVQEVVRRKVRQLLLDLNRKSRSDPATLPSVEDDRTAMAMAISEAVYRGLRGKHFSDEYLRGILQILIKTLFIDRGNPDQQQQFQEAFGKLAPSFLLLAPGKACNLRCPGCYSDSDDRKASLEWSLIDRIVEEAKEPWGERLFVISGGEPFAYRSEGKGILEFFEKHQDSFFLVYTNGTLIDDDVSRRLSQTGNVLLCLSLEGFRALTDARRGDGVFDTVMKVTDRLNRDGVPFGVSLTATCHNVGEILSEEFIDFIMDKGALLAFMFHYMPIGRSFTLDLMPTPEQRAWMWKRSWEIVRQKQFFVADFWNHGTCVDGCVSAGGHGQGGYFSIDWNGTITPCVLMPYSPLNIRDVYAEGKTLNDVWQHPFFGALRRWQYDYIADTRGTLSPYPNRDHHDELERLLLEYRPEPTDANAAETLVDPEYPRGLVAYNRRFEELTNGIREEHYLRRTAAPDELFARLPDLPAMDRTAVEPPSQAVSASTAAQPEVGEESGASRAEREREDRETAGSRIDDAEAGDRSELTRKAAG